jgi:hypothetical protein
MDTAAYQTDMEAKIAGVRDVAAATVLASTPRTVGEMARALAATSRRIPRARASNSSGVARGFTAGMAELARASKNSDPLPT